MNDWSYTRRRFGGRQPLWGIGVISRMLSTSIPTLWMERIPASRPEPGPLTNTSTFRRPRSYASFAAASALTWAANGVFFLDPLKPFRPAEDQLMTLP